MTRDPKWWCPNEYYRYAWDEGLRSVLVASKIRPEGLFTPRESTSPQGTGRHTPPPRHPPYTHCFPRGIRIFLSLLSATGQTSQPFFNPELGEASPATSVTSERALLPSAWNPPTLRSGGWAARQGGRKSEGCSQSGLMLQQLKWPFSLGLGFHLHRAPEKRCAFGRIRADNSVHSENKIKPERNWETWSIGRLCKQA